MISKLQIISFLVNLPLIFLNEIVIITNPIIPPVIIIFIGETPINTPFWNDIFCGFTKYNNANVTPPKVNETK